MLAEYYNVNHYLDPSKYPAIQGLAGEIDIQAESGIEKDRLLRLANESITDIIRFVPEEVADCDSFFALCKKYGVSEDADIFWLIECAKSVKKDSSNKGGKISLSDIDDAFIRYSNPVAQKIKTVKKAQFIEFTHAVNYYPYNVLATHNGLGLVDRNGNSATKDILLETMIDVCNKLQIPKDKRVDYIHSILTEEFSEFIWLNTADNRLSKYDTTEAMKIKNEVTAIISKAKPIDVIKRLFVLKYTTYFSEDHRVKNTTKAFNDTLFGLESGICKRFLDADITRDTSSIIIIDPTPFCVEKIISFGVDIKTVFVVESPYYADMYEAHYQNARHCGAVNNLIEFKTVDEFLAQDLEYNNATVAIYQNTMEDDMVVDLAFKFKDKKLQILATDSAVKRIMQSVDSLAKIIVLPSKLSNLPVPKFRSIALLQPIKSETVTITVMKEFDNSYATQFLYRDKSLVFERMQLCDIAGDSLRKCIRNAEECKKNKQRRKSKMYHFTPELVVRYSDPVPNKSGKQVGKVCLISKSGDKVLESERSFKVDDGEIISWIINKYPDRLGIKEAPPIREIMKNQLLLDYEHKPISLKSIWFMIDEDKDYFSPRQYKIVKNLMGTGLATMPGNCTLNDYMYATDENLLIALSCNRYELVDILTRFIGISRDLGFIPERSWEELKQERENYISGIRNISKQLTCETLELKDMKSVYKMLNDKDSELSVDEKLAIKIRMLTGLEREALCAIERRHIKKISDNYVALMIDQVVDIDGRNNSDVNRINQRRRVPCPRGLSEDILRRLDSISVNKNAPLLKGTNGRRLSPRRVNEVSKMIIKKLNVPNNYALIPDTRKAVRSIDLSTDSVDFFRKSFSLYGRSIGSMFEEEIRFVLGIQRTTPAGKNYIDFDSSKAQERLRKGIQIIEDQLKGGDINDQ